MEEKMNTDDISDIIAERIHYYLDEALESRSKLTMGHPYDFSNLSKEEVYELGQMDGGGIAIMEMADEIFGKGTSVRIANEIAMHLIVDKAMSVMSESKMN